MVLLYSYQLHIFYQSINSKVTYKIITTIFSWSYFQEIDNSFEEEKKLSKDGGRKKRGKVDTKRLELFAHNEKYRYRYLYVITNLIKHKLTSLYCHFSFSLHNAFPIHKVTYCDLSNISKNTSTGLFFFLNH